MGERRLTEKQWQAISDLREHWHAYCDADYRDLDFIDRMEAAGFVRLRSVRKADLEESFAAERGIELGGMIYELTAKGRRELSAT